MKTKELGIHAPLGAIVQKYGHYSIRRLHNYPDGSPYYDIIHEDDEGEPLGYIFMSPLFDQFCVSTWYGLTAMTAEELLRLGEFVQTLDDHYSDRDEKDLDPEG